MVDETEINFPEDEIFREVYVLAASVEVYVPIRGEMEHIKIDALRRGKEYSTSAYIKRYITFDEGTVEEGIERGWVHFSLGTTRGDSAEQAIRQALEFVRDGCGQI